MGMAYYSNYQLSKILNVKVKVYSKSKSLALLIEGRITKVVSYDDSTNCETHKTQNNMNHTK